VSKIIDLAQKAGKVILAIYNKDFAVYDKPDASPLTEADLAAHQCIVAGLKELTPDIPVLSEESTEEDIKWRMEWSRYWLIDPLDGTKEFIKKNGEFTVNIALIENHQPVFGVVYAPVLETTWWGQPGQGAFKINPEGQETPIQVRTRPANKTDWKIVGSRSHQSDDFKAFIQQFSEADVVSIGSSLKLCLVAEGSADLYPRLGPTSEWDTAAAQAVVEAAGGQVLAYPDLNALRYNTRTETLLNPYFLVCERPL
jgi:3'(2'), 5'-bisphosphate nucleotidase